MCNTTTYRRANEEREKKYDRLKFLYLEYVNNFLTIKGFAEYFGLTLDDAIESVTAGRRLIEAGK